MDLMFYFEVFKSSNYREGDIKIYNPKKQIILVFFIYVTIKGRSKGEVSFSHTKHMLFQSVIEIDP